MRSWYLMKNLRAVYGWRPSSEMRASMSTYMFGYRSSQSATAARSSASLPKWAQMNVVFGCRAMTRCSWASRSWRLGNVVAVEEPVGVLVQLVPALVVAVQRREEGGRVGGVDHDRPLVLAADLPDRVELRVVDRHELAVLVAVAQPEGLVELQALGPGLEARLQPLGLALAPAASSMPVEVDQGEGEEPAGMGLVEGGEGLLEPVAPAAVEVDDRLHAGRVHLREIVLDTLPA